MVPFEKQTEMRKTLTSLAIIIVAVVLGILLTSKEGIDRYVSKDFLFGFSRQAIQTPVLAESIPTRLRIPSIYVDTNFVPLGLQENGEVEVPKGYTEVGWYTYGPTPGERGPAVVLGHVDSYQGPGVFLFLGQLKPGDVVYVDREDGTTATFKVTELQRYNRSEFPTESVYGDIPYAGIRLITCTGTYSQNTQEYDRVLVVYGELVVDASTKTQ
jgi:sortase (surface protein transpeptidase)